MNPSSDEHDLLIRVDERTHKMAKDICSIKNAIELVIEPQCERHKIRLATHDTEIAVLKTHWKIAVGIVTVGVSVTLFVVELALH